MSDIDIDRALTDRRELVAALAAVLGLHHRDVGGGDWCEDCQQDWPCRTYEAIAQELT